MARALWKGAISFGLVHIPVTLSPASRDDALDFDWLDRRSMEPVGYKRINKATGKEVPKGQMVRGLQVEGGRYVVLSDEEIEQAYPAATRTIDIERFVPPEQIPFVLLERPYYLQPADRGEKVYALLREALAATRRVGIARVVLQRRQHLAALVPAGPALMLNTLRWANEIRPWQDLKLPKPGAEAAGLKARELEMARQLVMDMGGDWDPTADRDTFRDDILALVQRKVKAGRTEEVEPIAPRESPAKASNVVDLADLLRRSLRGGEAAQPAADDEARPKARPKRQSARSSKAATASAGRGAAAKSRRKAA